MVTKNIGFRVYSRHLLGIAIASLAAGCTSDPALCPCEDPGYCAGTNDAGFEAAHDAASEADLNAIEQFCSSTLGFQTSLYDQCCDDSDKAQSAWSFMRGVADALSFECSDKLKKSAENGRISLDSAAAASCAQSFQSTFAARACEMVWTAIDWEQSACRHVVAGRQGEGALCRYRYECADGLFCNGYTDGLDGTCGLPPQGGSCRAEEASFAADDVMDSYLGNHPSCAPGRSCQQLTTLGFCTKTSAEGGSCVLHRDCDPGLRCHLGACGTAGPAAAGQPCRSSGDCVPRLLCVFAPGATEGTCIERKPDGEACSPNIDECRGLCIQQSGDATATCKSFCGSG